MVLVLLLPPDASPDDRRAFSRAAGWLAPCATIAFIGFHPLLRSSFMATEKAARILRKKNAPFTEQQILSMPDSSAWGWIREHDRQRQESKAKERLPHICFTGFSDSDKERLKTVAQQAGFDVRGSVTKSCSFLVIGDDPGQVKLEKAMAQGCKVITEAAFVDYLNNREALPPP